jgi:hypothetical protein
MKGVPSVAVFELIFRFTRRGQGSSGASDSPGGKGGLSFLAAIRLTSPKRLVECKQNLGKENREKKTKGAHE